MIDGSFGARHQIALRQHTSSILDETRPDSRRSTTTLLTKMAGSTLWTDGKLGSGGMQTTSGLAGRQHARPHQELYLGQIQMGKLQHLRQLHPHCHILQEPEKSIWAVCN